MTKTVKWMAIPSVVGLLAIGLFAQQATAPASLDRRLTGNFENATLKDVLKWLSQQGVSFVARADADGNARLSLNIQDQPMADVMDAIALAFDSEWEKKGNTYVLKQSIRGRAFEAVPFGPDSRVFEGSVAPPDLKILEGQEMPPRVLKELFKEGVPIPPMVFDEKTLKDWETDPKAKAEWQKHAKEAEKWAKEFEKKFNNPKFQAEMEKHAAEMEKHAKEFEKKFNNPKFQAEMEKHAAEMEKHAKEFEKKFDNPKFRAEMEKHAAEMEKRAKEFEKKFDNPKFRAEMEKHAAEMEKHAKEFEKKFNDPEFKAKLKSLDGKVFIAPDTGALKELEHLGRLKVSGSMPIKKFIGTITAAQWAKHAKQGHLKFADLTPAQKEMVRNMVDGESWNFSFVLDGKKLNLRSK